VAEAFETPGLGSARSPLETIHTPWTVLGPLTTTTAAFGGTADSLVTTRPETEDDIGRYVIEAPFANHLALALVGTDAEDETLIAGVNGWRPVDDSGTKWVKHRLADLLGCKLGNAVGVGSGIVTSGVRFVYEIDTMIDYTYAQSLVMVGGPAAGLGIPYLVLDYTGYPLLEIRLTRGTGEGAAASAGGMYHVF
jgi:hypothetical protein